ncbi:MAG: hypothetical protein KDH96_07410 [Candidatus Riesia sp.]|nr:hypothetical protein [Candidatus Riesia sp.]
MADLIYTPFKAGLMAGNIDLSADVIKVMLTTASYVPNASDELTGDVTNEISSAGYSAGGVPITNQIITTNGNSGVLNGDNITFSGITATFSGAVIYISGATPSTSYLLGFLDLGTQTVTAGDFTITWDANGIYNLG